MKPEQGQPYVSVVIAVFNGGPDLEKCLAAIRASTYPVFECILVDDASTDGMVIPATERHGVRVIRLEQQCGPARARNQGAQEARGEILFFTDADVLLHPDALELAVQAFQAEPAISAVFGSYDDQPEHVSFISQYRNLFHHWVHQTGAEEASTFWTGCGAIRRDIFMEMGGFSQDYARPSIEDIELGARLRKSGYRIRLLKNMLGTHMKRWSFWNTIKTDIFHRGVPWMLLMLKNRQMTSDLNLSYKSRLATVAAGLLGVSLPVLVLAGPLGATPSLALIPLALVLVIIGTHLGFYRYVAKKRSYAFAIGAIPMQVVFFSCCAVSVPLAYIEYYLDKRATKANARHAGDID